MTTKQARKTFKEKDTSKQEGKKSNLQEINHTKCWKLQDHEHSQRDQTDKNTDASTKSIFQESYSKMIFPTLLGEKKKAALRTTLSQMANKLNRASVVMAGPDKALSLARKAVFDDIFKPPLLKKWQVMESIISPPYDTVKLSKLQFLQRF